MLGTIRTVSYNLIYTMTTEMKVRLLNLQVYMFQVYGIQKSPLRPTCLEASIKIVGERIMTRADERQTFANLTNTTVDFSGSRCVNDSERGRPFVAGRTIKKCGEESRKVFPGGAVSDVFFFAICNI